MKTSKTGYKKDSKDKDEKSLRINSNSITMEDVEHPVLGIDDLGNTILMRPGVNNYSFPGNYVREYPIKQWPMQNYFQKGGNQPMTSYQWNQYNQTLGYQPVDSSIGNPYREFYNPKEYFKDNNGGFTKISDKGKTVNYNNDPTYNPFIKYTAGQSSAFRGTPKPQATVQDPMKAVGFNGTLTPVVEQYQKGGGLDKFVKNYTKKLGSNSDAPQGFSMDDYLTEKNDQFIDYIAANTKNALFKEEMGLLQNNRHSFQSGGQPNNFDPNYWANLEESPNQNQLSGQPAASNFYQQGPFGPYGQQSLPTYLPKQPKQEIDPDWQGSGVDLNPDIMDIVNRTKQKSGQMDLETQQPNPADVVMLGIQGLNSFLSHTESTRQKNILNDKFTIENMATTNYGSRGDYDINQGNFRPDQYVKGFQKGGAAVKQYKKGSSHELSQEEIQRLIQDGYDIQFED